MYEEFFANRLAELRHQKKISAREMSLAIGQNESYINRIENKLNYPSMQGFFYICEYLNITPQQFFDTQNPAPEKITEALTLLKNLPTEQINIIVALLETMQNKKDWLARFTFKPN
mgnify:FL=1